MKKNYVWEKVSMAFEVVIKKFFYKIFYRRIAVSENEEGKFKAKAEKI